MAPAATNISRFKATGDAAGVGFTVRWSTYAAVLKIGHDVMVVMMMISFRNCVIQEIITNNVIIY